MQQQPEGAGTTVRGLTAALIKPRDVHASAAGSRPRSTTVPPRPRVNRALVAQVICSAQMLVPSICLTWRGDTGLVAVFTPYTPRSMEMRLKTISYSGQR